MVDWHSPAEIAHDAREVISPSTLTFISSDAEALSHLIHVLFGLYL